jgi:1-acyl-sn-glycerol-3-phosphate acyltransferase
MFVPMVDRKNKIAQSFFTWLNKVVLGLHFQELKFSGLEHIPASGPFLAIANHQSRWDGLLLFNAINRVANYMVSPNELKGFQGNVIRSLGGFPADPRSNLLPYMQERLLHGEGIAIFPEGDVFRDGIMHPFKKGAARLILDCYEKGIELPVVPIAIHYEGATAHLVASGPMNLEETIQLGKQMQSGVIEMITGELQERVIAVKNMLARSAATLAIEVERNANLSDPTNRCCEIA